MKCRFTDDMDDFKSQEIVWFLNLWACISNKTSFLLVDSISIDVGNSK